MNSSCKMCSLALLGVCLTTSKGFDADGPDRGKTSPDGEVAKVLHSGALSDDDLLEAELLGKKIDDLRRKGQYADAMTAAQSLVKLRTANQGADHWETVDAQVQLELFETACQMDMATQKLLVESDDQMRQYLNASSKNPGAGVEVAEKALELRRRVLGEDHVEVAFSLLAVADHFETLGRFDEAIPPVEKALPIIRKHFGDEHPKMAQCNERLGMNLAAVGRYAQAKPLIDKACEIRTRVFGENHIETSASYVSVAYALAGLSRHAEAASYLRRAIEIRQRELGDEDPSTTTCYDHLGQNLKLMGKHSEAEQILLKALRVRRKTLGDDDLSTAASFASLAANAAFQGKFVATQLLAERSLAVYLRVYGEEHPLTASSYDLLSWSLRQQGNLVEAESLNRKTLAIRKKLYGDAHPDLISSYAGLGNVLLAQGKMNEANEVLKQSLETCIKVLGERHPTTAQMYNNLAAILNSQERFDEAQPLYEKAAKQWTELYGENHSDVALVTSGIASNLSESGKHHEALPYYQKAIELFHRTLGDDHPYTARTHDGYAFALRGLGRFDDALKEMKTAAELCESGRAKVGLSGLRRSIWSAQYSRRTLLAATAARWGNAVDGWQYLEADLGRGLLDDMAARYEGRASVEEQSEFAQLEQRVATLDRLYGQQTPGKPVPVQLRDERTEARVALGELRSKLTEKYGLISGRVLSFEEVQQRLPEDAALVAWLDAWSLTAGDADPDGDHWAVVVRKTGEPTWVDMPGTGPKGQWTVDDRELSKRFHASCVNEHSDWRHLADQLRAQRIKPLMQDLGKTVGDLPPVKHLVVLPSNWLIRVPIDCLLRESDSFTVTYAPSATVLSRLLTAKRTTSSGGLLAVGDPVFRGESEDSAKELRLPPDKLIGEATGSRSGYARLPGTAVEVDRLARLFAKQGLPAKSLVRNQASEPVLDRLADSDQLRDYRFLHIATHGAVDQNSPFRSALILSDAELDDPLEQYLNNQPVVDGRITVDEIRRRWRLGAELVTLSACDTALGADAGGEGLVGFAQALLISGSQSVCLSLWKVDDLATTLLMGRFYENLLGARDDLGVPLEKGEALHESQRWLRTLTRTEAQALASALNAGLPRGKGQPAKPLVVPDSQNDENQPFAHPTYWAAFVLIGDYR